MGALREKMIEEMRLRNFSLRTEQSYIAAMVGLVKYYRQSPDQLTQDEIRSYLLRELTGTDLSRCPRCQKGTMIVVGELPPLSSSLRSDSS